MSSLQANPPVIGLVYRAKRREGQPGGDLEHLAVAEEMKFVDADLTE